MTITTINTIISLTKSKSRRNHQKNERAPPQRAMVPIKTEVFGVLVAEGRNGLKWFYLV